jgi:hypothetical protein
MNRNFFIFKVDQDCIVAKYRSIIWGNDARGILPWVTTLAQLREVSCVINKWIIPSHGVEKYDTKVISQTERAFRKRLLDLLAIINLLKLI